MPRYFLRLSVRTASCALLLMTQLASAELKYPQARNSDQTDTYHGVTVADPYRWLEDDRSAETTQWVTAENQLTKEYLARIPYRQAIQARLKQLLNYPKYSAPIHRGDHFFFSRNDGLQNQNVWYEAKSLDDAPRVLLDPNQFSADGTSRLLEFSPSRNGKYVAYAVSQGGSDWEQAHVLEVLTGKVFPDHLDWLKISALSWSGDGFFYSRYPTPAAGHELSSQNANHKVYYHHIGDPQDRDELIFEDPQHPQRFHTVNTTEDERFAILTVSDRGTGKDGNALFYCDLTQKQRKFLPIVETVANDTYHVIDNVGDTFLISTNWTAPRGRIVSFDPKNSRSPWKDVIAQTPDSLVQATVAGKQLLVGYSKDVASRMYVYSLAGDLQSEVQLPGPGTVMGIEGNTKDRFAFYLFTSLNYPATIFRYDLPTKNSVAFHSPDIPGFQPGSYESKEVFYPSKDGTRIPMFLVYKKGLKLDGTNPTLLYAYGGFNISTDPTFSALRLALLEQGFVYASANIRGGGEYGEEWHHAGMKSHKQNVFDDFISAAEWLVANRYTNPDKLAIHGISNGGLLMGAVMNQRPDLFRVALAQAGVMDMLRFQKFTIGWNWIADYGSSDNPDEFKTLYSYSPLQNIKAGVRYPAVLITTADHDDRVIPGHSFKYAATLQAKASPVNPVFIRIDTNSGHGPSSTTKQLEQTADLYAFLFHNLQVTPHYIDIQAHLTPQAPSRQVLRIV